VVLDDPRRIERCEFMNVFHTIGIGIHGSGEGTLRQALIAYPLCATKFLDLTRMESQGISDTDPRKGAAHFASAFRTSRFS